MLRILDYDIYKLSLHYFPFLLIFLKLCLPSSFLVENGFQILPLLLFITPCSLLIPYVTLLALMLDKVIFTGQVVYMT